MKPWQLNKRVNNLSTQLADSTKINNNRLELPKRTRTSTLNKVDEIIKQYAPAQPPKDVIEIRRSVIQRLEIFGRRATELFIETVPASLLV
jgi:hypothetical protein